MALVNIPRDRDDPNYRYKMPKLISKIEGRGNGIKTNISNMGEISRALKRPPMYPTKFFGCELGAMAKFEEAEEKALVNGAHKESDLVVILDKFIQMYVLCPSCELPEIDINVKKGLLTCKCNACGYIGSLDNLHKAATYMVRNPPDVASSTMGKKKKSKEERRAEKQQQRDKKDRTSRKSKSLEGEENEEKEGEEGEEKQQENGEEDGGSGGSSCSNTRSSADNAGVINGAETQSTKKSRAERSADATPTNEGETDSWDEQPQEKSREARRRERRERRAAAAAEAEKRQLLHKEALVFESPELQDVIERLRNVIVKSGKVDISAFFQELRMLQVSQDFDSKCRMYVTLGALFKDGITPVSLEKNMAYVTKVVDSSVSAADVLDALGHFAYEQGTASLANFPYFLQKLYNAEVLEADDILKYYKEEKADPLYTACRKHAGPFLQWLREDDDSEEEEKSCVSEESDEDEEEEEEEEEVAEREKKDKGRKESEETAGANERTDKAGKKKDKEEAKKGGEEKKKKGGKGQAEKSEEDEDDDEEELKEKEGKRKGQKEKKENKHSSNGNNNAKKGGANASQVEETGSGGEKGKGKKEDNQQKNGGGKGKKKEKK